MLTPTLRGAKGSRLTTAEMDRNISMLADAVNQVAAFDPRAYGAAATGASRTVQQALGVTTKSALAAVQVDGATPYAWITGSRWKNHTNLDLSAAAAAGATSLSFASTAGVAVGNTVHGTGVPSGATVTAVAANSVTISAGMTAAKAAGMTVSFQSPLTDAQAAALQMDGLALQSAVEAARAAGGGTVRLGRGTYMIDRAIVIPDRHEGSGAQVNVVGEGIYLTALRATADQGAGKFVICCGDPSGAKGHLVGRYSAAYYEGTCAEFRVLGPTGAPAANGSSPCAMSGIGHGARRRWINITSWYFRNGMEVVGDHTDMHLVTLQYCYYGAYFADANPVLYGDFRFYDCFFMGNSFAGIGVSKNALVNALFVKPYFGGEPYHVVGEAGTADSYGQPFAGSAEMPIMQGCHFHLPQCEWAGNGSVVDLNGGADGTGTRRRTIVSTVYFGGLWSWDTGKAISGRGQRYYFDVGAMEGVEFHYPSTDGFPTTAGQLAAFRTGAVGWFGGGVRFVGSMGTILGKYGTIPFFAEAFGRFSVGQWRHVTFHDLGWTARLAMIGGTAAVPAGTVMEAGGDFQGARPAVSGNTNPLVGITVGGDVPALGAAADRLVPVAVGEGLQPRFGGGTNAAGQWLKVHGTTAGTVTNATGPADGKVVGWAWHDNGGGTNKPTVRTAFA